VQHLKGKTSLKLQQEFKPLQKEYWGRHIWARGYFAASSGNITDEMIMEYINNQEDLQVRNINITVEVKLEVKPIVDN
jgi:putative transposase